MTDPRTKIWTWQRRTQHHRTRPATRLAADLAEADLAEADLAQADPVQADPAETDPVQTGPDQAGPAQPPARPRSAAAPDGHSLAYRAFYALPVENFSTTDRAAHQRGLRLHLDADQRPARREADARRRRLRLSRAHLPPRGSSPSTRPTATRRPTSSAGQVSLIYEVLDALRHPRLSRGGLRGRRHHRDAGRRRPRRGTWTSLIVTGDRDAFQLVNDHVTVLYPSAGSATWPG